MEDILHNTHIKLISGEGALFQVPVKIARCSEYLNSNIELVGMTNLNRDPIILENVKTSTLSKVLAWMEHHQNDVQEAEKEARQRQSLISRLLHQLVPCIGNFGRNRNGRWDEEFLQINAGNLRDLTELCKAANYLRIDRLEMMIADRLNRFSQSQESQIIEEEEEIEVY